MSAVNRIKLVLMILNILSPVLDQIFKAVDEYREVEKK